MTSQPTDAGKELVTVIPGDGIGPECVDAAKRLIEAAGAPIAWVERHAGERVFKQGIASGVPVETIESIRETRCVLKGPLGTPVGFGEKSANVTLRKLFETYGNIRPVREVPGVTTPYSGRGIDLVVVRENVEDLYAGIENMQTPGVAQCLKLISRKGSEKIVRLGFEFARAEGRKRVHCATKSNIMKLTEGTMKRTFEAVAKEYPDIESQHIIVDNCAHQLVKKPEQFDVIITTNMNGDILSDLTSALIGGLGFAPSANIGNEVAIFEAVHGSAPKYAGKDVINPTAVIMSAVLMLRHLQMFDAADRIEQAVLVTLESGVITRDILGDSGRAAPTSKYVAAIEANLGRSSTKWPTRAHQALKLPEVSTAPDFVKPNERKVVGLDVFIDSGLAPDELGRSLEALTAAGPARLKVVTNRGTKVYPSMGTVIDCVDLYQGRFLPAEGGELSDDQIFEVVRQVASKHRWAHIEKLQTFDGEPSFTKAQGED